MSGYGISLAGHFIIIVKIDGQIPGIFVLLRITLISPVNLHGTVLKMLEFSQSCNKK